MSFLAPLFLLGATAIALPIIFHLIRRTSREKVTFSSLMFLDPSPPRLTRKSRLENILLLILRCAVLALLAFAFARPFLRNPLAPDNPASAKRTVVLIDNSASMRRENLWNEAQAEAEKALRNASAADQVALVAFNRTIQPLLAFNDWTRAAPNERPAIASQRLKALAPTWASTHIGNALISASELLEQDAGPSILAKEIIVISDFQDGARLEGLQGFEWPKDTRVQLDSVKPKRRTNAGVQILPEATAAVVASEVVKVRVNNSSESAREQFQVRWAGNATTAVAVYVPPGQSRTVELPKPQGADRVLLTGDDVDFDNTAFFVPPRQEQIEVLFITDAMETDTKRMLFYIKRAFAETARQMINVAARKPGESLGADTNAALLVIDTPVSEAGAAEIASAVRAGKTVLLALSSQADAAMVQQFTGIPVTAEEAQTSGYAMLGEIDFAHPIFAPFADPRFSDFTKIHFWKHRRLNFDASPSARVVARFDKGDPAIAQFSVGKGNVFVLTSGWQPSDSQLALSSKFVPMLYSLLEISGSIRAQLSAFTVGDEVDLRGIRSSGDITVTKPDGTSVSSDGPRFAQTDLPGAYTITTDPPTAFAVNLAAEESKTTPLAVEELERLRVPVKVEAAVSPKRVAQREAQLRAAELESRQKLWRWLIAATLMVLIVETWVAARGSRRGAVLTEAAS